MEMWVNSHSQVFSSLAISVEIQPTMGEDTGEGEAYRLLVWIILHSP